MAESFNHQHVANTSANVAKEKFKWQWHCGSRWKDYRISDSTSIEYGYKSKRVVHIIVNGMEYTIDTFKCKQINILTNCNRNIRRIPINHTDNTYYGTKNYKTEGKTYKTKQHITTQQNKNASSSQPKILWQWLHTTGKWIDYDAPTSKLLDQKHISQDDKIFDCRIRYHSTNDFGLYSINLATMKQSNMETGKTRDIRRIFAADMLKNNNSNGNYGLNNIESELKEIVDSMDLNIPKNVVAKNFANQPHQKLKYSNQMNDIKQILMNKQQRTQILCKAKWHDNNKIPIFDKKCSKKKLTLSLEKQEFIDRLLKFSDANDSSVHLVPILVDGDKNKIVKYLWIVTIEQCKNVTIDIGISLQLTKTIKKVKTVVPVGIHLDINEENKLVNSDKFNLILDELKIGSVNSVQTIENKMENKLEMSNCYKWQWNNEQTYIDFDSKISNEMEILYQDQAETYEYINAEKQQMYTVKFNELKMYNEHSQKCINIRRILMNWKESDGGSKVYSDWNGPKQTIHRKIFENKITTLYSVTDQRIIVGAKGAVSGIYFVESIQAAKCNVNNDNGVLITAKVFIGKEYVLKDSNNNYKQFTFEYLQSIGYDSIYIPIGKQRVVYNWDQVCVIKQEPLNTQQ